MIDPISWILFGLGSLLIGAAVISIAFLSIAVVASLFEEWEDDNSITDDDVGILTEILTNQINSSNATHVQGVFNKRANKVRDAWRIQADSVDSELRQLLSHNGTVIFDK